MFYRSVTSAIRSKRYLRKVEKLLNRPFMLKRNVQIFSATVPATLLRLMRLASCSAYALKMAAIPVVCAGSHCKKVRVNASFAVIAESQLLAVEASVGYQAGERPAAEQASATSTSAAVTPPGSRPATAHFNDVISGNRRTIGLNAMTS